MDKLISLSDIPVIIIIGLGIWIPAFLPLRRYSILVRFSINKVIVAGVSFVAAIVSHALARADIGLVFTRAFLIIGIAHVVLTVMYLNDKQKAAMLPVTPPLDASK